MCSEIKTSTGMSPNKSRVCLAAEKAAKLIFLAGPFLKSIFKTTENIHYYPIQRITVYLQYNCRGMNNPHVDTQVNDRC